MAWKHLTIDDLRLVLAEDEVEKLNSLSLSEDVEEVVNKQLDVVADMFRGSWKAQGYKVDTRDHYVAPEYVNYILNYARWQIWTRFPSTEDFSLTEPRKLGYEEAVEILKKPFIDPSDPSDPSDPDNPNNPEDGIDDSAVTMPWLRFQPLPGECGFPKAYFSKGNYPEW